MESPTSLGRAGPARLPNYLAEYLMIFLQSLSGWHWLGLGLILLLAQFAYINRAFVGVGAGAVFVALVMSITPVAWPLQWAMFVIFSFAGTIIYWRYFRVKPAQNATEKLAKRKPALIGTRASLLVAVRDGRGKVQIGDAVWSAACGQDLPAGTIVEVTGYDDQSLHVSRVQPGAAALASR